MNGRPTGLSDFGLLFGISRKEYVNICAVIPLDELIVGAKTLRDYEEANLLRTLLDEIRDDIRANGCNQTCPVKLQGLTRLMFEKMNTRELIKKVKKRGLGKTYFKSNNPELRFLGVYYYNKDLLTHDYEMDKIIDNFAEEKQEQLHDIRQKILKKVEAVKKHLESKETSFSPKFLFFEKQTQFKKIDNIMKGLIPFFQARSGKIGKFHGLPIIVCMDDIGQTKRWMCLGYRKSEGIYKRLRYYSKK